MTAGTHVDFFAQKISQVCLVVAHTAVLWVEREVWIWEQNTVLATLKITHFEACHVMLLLYSFNFVVCSSHVKDFFIGAVLVSCDGDFTDSIGSDWNLDIPGHVLVTILESTVGSFLDQLSTVTHFPSELSCLMMLAVGK